MNNYPEVVATIVNDYLDRVKSQLRLVPPRQQDEFLMEIHSHIYEAYREMPGENDVARILAVLRNLGEPAEVVSDRLPASMVRSGTKRNLPLYILGGILIALFGIPLGFGGVAVLAGILITLAAVLAAYYVTLGSLLLTGALFALLGLARISWPGLWDKLVALGVIGMNGPPAEFFDQFSASGQGLMLIGVAAVCIVTGLGMLRLGKYLLRGLRFLYNLAFDWLRQSAQSIRRKFHREKQESLNIRAASFVK